MVADLDTAAKYARLEPEEAQLLASPQRPIVLLRKFDVTGLAQGVAPENPDLGIMLAYSPLHLLLVRPDEVWVMTSGNLADEPICYENADALTRLSSICDGFLVHDRLIETVCDDSVVRVYRSRPLPIRRSRGYCPLPIEVRSTNLDDNSICALAVGGEIKTTVCLTIGTQAILGQHLGDTGNQETLLALEHSVDHLLELYGAKPDVIVADAHPDYLSAAWARKKATQWGVPWITVQHHHAHAISLSAEHGLDNEPLIACVFDGTGFGPDGAIWGGEWLIASPQEYRRFARLEYTALPGGDAAIRRPAKTALAQLFHYGLEWDERLPCVQALSNAERKLLKQQLQNRFHAPSTSSMGRLFDCVASLCGVRQRVHYEGQAAIELEVLAATLLSSEQDADRNDPAYPSDWQRREAWVWNYRDMMLAMIGDQLAGIGADQIAARFHATLAEATTEICKKAREETSINTVGLSGGVFQNVLLTELTNTLLERDGFRVLTHRQVPPNDGGLALGQAVIGRAMLRG
jgi:hydrogenase maturation protein HypF